MVKIGCIGWFVLMIVWLVLVAWLGMSFVVDEDDVLGIVAWSWTVKEMRLGSQLGCREVEDVDENS